MGWMERLTSEQVADLQRAALQEREAYDGPVFCTALSVAREQGIEGEDALAFAARLEREVAGDDV